MSVGDMVEDPAWTGAVYTAEDHVGIEDGSVPFRFDDAVGDTIHLQPLCR